MLWGELSGLNRILTKNSVDQILSNKYSDDGEIGGLVWYSPGDNFWGHDGSDMGVGAEMFFKRVNSDSSNNGGKKEHYFW